MATTHAFASSTALVPPPRRWDATNIPSQYGKIAIVTGANSGIGFVVALELARKGASVVMACRSAARGQYAAKRIRDELALEEHEEAVGRVLFMQLDVSSLASVQSFVQSFKTKFDRLDLLISNAGIMAVPYAETVDGYESQFATNHLGHFALTASLFDLLKAGAPSRVVNVSSLVHKFAHMDVDHIMTSSKRKYWPFIVYGNSKLCNILFTLELARRLKAQNIDGVTSVVAHPGIVLTHLTDAPLQSPGWLDKLAWRVFTWLPIFQSVEMGALPTLYAATAPGVVSGQYYGPRNFMGQSGYPAIETPGNASHSLEAASKLWSFSDQLAKLQFHVQ